MAKGDDIAGQLLRTDQLHNSLLIIHYSLFFAYQQFFVDIGAVSV